MAFLDHFEVTKHGKVNRAKCPAHDDKKASLSLTKKDENWLIHCFAGCSPSDVLEAAGCSFSDLYEHSEPIANIEYLYRDRDGNHRYTVVRTPDKKFFQKNASGESGIKGVIRLPYRLPELLASTGIVYIPEGEKDVDRLRSLGLTATCNSGGAGQWLPEFAEYFEEREVIVLPDNDDPGRQHADMVAGSLPNACVITLDVKPKGDVSDWLDAGGDIETIKFTSPINGIKVDISSIVGKSPTQRQCEFPVEVYNVPGVISLFCRHCSETALYPQPKLELAAALSLLSVITGRKIEDDFKGTRTNLMTIGIAPSGSGKDHSRQKVKRILDLVGANEMVGPERIGSSAGLVSFVQMSPSILFQLDEMGRLLETMQIAKATHLFNIASVMMAMYTSSDVRWIGEAYADTRRTPEIDQPHCVIYGTATAESVWNVLKPENAVNGMLGRLMVFEETYSSIQKPSLMEIPGNLIEIVSAWTSFNPKSSNLKPVVTVAKYSSAALCRVMGHMEAVSERRIKEDPVRAAIWSRCTEKTSKLALLFACSEGPGLNLTIEKHHVDLAIKLSKWVTQQILKGCGLLAQDDKHRNLIKVLGVIKSWPGIAKRELSRKTQFVRKRERDDILRELEEMGEITKVNVNCFDIP